MLVSISNTILQNWIFISIFVILVLASFRLRKDSGFSISVTNELKGLAILAIVFSHIGYFLVTDHQFLFPLSVLAGVGVNLFLFLSGFGLTVSSIKREETIWQFYKRRLLKLFVPFWLVLFAFLLMDCFVLGISYSKTFIAQSLFGIFTRADLYQSLNSPFWFMTLILFFYLLFPVFFFRKRPWLSAIILYAIVYFVLIKLNLSFFQDVVLLYKVHLVAFPLGIVFAWLFKETKISINLIYKKYEKFFYPVFSILLLISFCYFAIHSGVGEKPRIEETISIITMLVVVFLFLIKKFEFGIFSVFGIYSYEIYLLHWPIMYRYDIFYKYLPAWLAVFLYLILFAGLARILKAISEKIQRFDIM